MVCMTKLSIMLLAGSPENTASQPWWHTTCSPSTPETETGGSLRMQGQLGYEVSSSTNYTLSQKDQNRKERMHTAFLRYCHQILAIIPASVPQCHLLKEECSSVEASGTVALQTPVHSLALPQPTEEPGGQKRDKNQEALHLLMGVGSHSPTAALSQSVLKVSVATV